ncbi:MAG: hypothetical protein A3E25_10695 [Burkholderiales bacterium RIFCSPHIGHO2_12_FULL_69_20]|nr:MAG: hypothetical protein A3E25_10695 [Burkholderiales bacterium RIFCSPHIGHO2_12_FULL_69_20]
MDHQRASRRQAILKGLGKGGAVLAAASPLHSYATRNIVTTTGQQCTVSGNQSAAVSASAGTQQTCGAYHPRHFIAVSQSFSLTDNTGYNANQQAAFNALSGSAVPVGAEHWRADNLAVFIKTSATTMRRVARAGWPGTVAANATVVSVFPSAGTGGKSILAQLYDAWTSGPPPGETDLAYFLAAYLNAELGTPPPSFTAALPFDGPYVQTQYNTNYANALTFFKLVCVTDPVTRAFP